MNNFHWLKVYQLQDIMNNYPEINWNSPSYHTILWSPLYLATKQAHDK